MKAKKQLIVQYKGEDVNLWDFYDEQGNLLVEKGHVWDDNLDLSGRNMRDSEDNITIVENLMPDLSFLHVTGDVDVSSNSGLTNLSKLPHQIDGNLFANHCYGYHDVDGLPTIGKNLYLIGSAMEHRAYSIGCMAAMGGGDADILNQYPLEDEIVREGLPVKGQVFTPMGYVRWLDHNQKVLRSLSEKAYASDGKNKELAEKLYHWYPRYVAKHDPVRAHIQKQLSKDKDEYELREALKADVKESARLEALRRAEEKAKKEAEGEINKARSANHTQNTAGAKDWAQRQINADETPRRSIRKAKVTKPESEAVLEGKDLVNKLKGMQKGTFIIQMTSEEVGAYIEGISELKMRIDNYVKGEDKESFPVLVKLLELRKEFLFQAVNGEKGQNLEAKVVKKALEAVGYRGNGKRKEAKKQRVKQEAIAAHQPRKKNLKLVEYVPVVPTQQMPKREVEFKVPRKMKKELVRVLQKLHCFAVLINYCPQHVARDLSFCLLSSFQNNNQRK